MSAVSREIKLVVVGDDVPEIENKPNSGNNKTILLSTYIYKEYPKHIPLYFYNQQVDVAINKDTITLCLWNTTPHSRNDRLRDLIYSEVNVFLIVFSVVNRLSYQHVHEKWVPELKNYCPNAPFLLVGCHIEDRERLERGGVDHITTQEGEQLAQKINAIKYLECSAKTGENLAQVFEDAVKAVLDQTSFFKLPPITEYIFTFFSGKDAHEKETAPSEEKLIEELREYAQKREAEGEGYRRLWGDLMGGKPGAVKAKTARELADEVEVHGMALKKKFTSYEVDTLLEGDLGNIVKGYPDIVSYLQGNLQVEFITESQDNIHVEPISESQEDIYSSEGGLSY